MEWPAQALGEMVGQRLGAYEIVEPIGRGGMAVVYKALQPALRRHVAVKVLPPQFASEAGFRERFQREAETVASLEHPNILPIYDYGQEHDLPYIVMPLVSGGTMRDWLAQPITLERAIQVLSRLLNALEYAHTRSPAIIHRDIKPGNILMSPGDWPLLADFGLARIAEPSLRMTRTGFMVGTPEYMSPEQSLGSDVDHRADLYAMGIVLFEVLSGRLPYQGSSPVAIVRQHAQAEIPSPRSFNPGLSSVWDDVLKRALAKRADARFPSARAMSDAMLAAWAEVQRGDTEQLTFGMIDTDQLCTTATQALADGDWARVIGLCRAILAADPTHPEAVLLLTEAHAALRRMQPSGSRPDLVARTPAGPPPATLTIVAGEEAGRTLALDGRAFTIGRAAINNLRVSDLAVSRQHCRVQWLHGSYVLEDLKSSNGTYLNNSVVESAALQTGDRIQIGDIVLEFALLPQSEEPATTPRVPH